jgi:hypothetical protein
MQEHVDAGCVERRAATGPALARGPADPVEATRSLHSAVEAMRSDNAREAENDHNERSDAPPVLIERVQTIATLKPGPKYAEQHERYAQH